MLYIFIQFKIENGTLVVPIFYLNQDLHSHQKFYILIHLKIDNDTLRVLHPSSLLMLI